jgi:hypothetical protein
VHALAFLAGLALVAVALWEAFESILLPRRASPHRISRHVLNGLWVVWTWAARPVRGRAREGILSTYAILALLALFAVWASCLIIGFALLQVAIGSRLSDSSGHVHLPSVLYFSGSTFFTLGLGDVHPVSSLARLLSVIEAGTGFGFLAMVISYLPVLYQSFSRREVRVTMLDEWAASPPTAAVMLRRAFQDGDPQPFLALLKEWETGAAEMLESHLSYPILAQFRSQHDNQSWLASLTAVMDACALVLVGVRGVPRFQARLTFAIARHSVVDLSQVFHAVPQGPNDGRMTRDDLERLRGWLREAGVWLDSGPEADAHLAELRALYEPYVMALSRTLEAPLPGWLPPERLRYNWETTSWARTVRDEAH